MHTQSFAFRLRNKKKTQNMWSTIFANQILLASSVTESYSPHRLWWWCFAFFFAFFPILSSCPYFTLASRIFTLFTISYESVYHVLLFERTTNNREFHSTSNMWINMRFAMIFPACFFVVVAQRNISTEKNASERRIYTIQNTTVSNNITAFDSN